MSKVNINIKSVSSNKLEKIEINIDNNITNVKQLILYLIEYTIKKYKKNQELSNYFLPMDNEEIKNRSKSGKISFGGIFTNKKFNIEKINNDTLTAFNDGVVVIFIDDKKMTSLDEFIDIKNIKEITLIKLIMLAGRMW